MIFGSSYNLPKVYRLRAGVKYDSYGDPVESWQSPDKHELKRAEIQNVATLEEHDLGEHVVKGEKTLFVPFAADLNAEDRIESGGEVWKVNGEPFTRRGLASTVYTTAALKRAS